MNSSDIERIKFEEGDDLLEGIFREQMQLIMRYHEIENERGFKPVLPHEWGELDDRHVQARIRMLMWFVTEELGEAANCLKNKPWKQTETSTNGQHFYEELADALHFFVELCITSGLDAVLLASLYHRKRTVNVMRQETGY